MTTIKVQENYSCKRFQYENGAVRDSTWRLSGLC